MNHIEAYILVKYGQELSPCLTDENIRLVLANYYNIPISRQDLERMKEYPPKTKHLVKALSDKGFTQAKICQLTGLKQPAVSYHLNSEIKKPYVNPHLYGLIQHYRQKEIQNENY